MEKKHNIKRYGELWPSWRIQLGLEILNVLKDYVVISGGWAWHFMSPENHPEYKHAHDHKDIDIFVRPKQVAEVMPLLLINGFQKVWTRYDQLNSPENFRRYEKIEKADNRDVRITIDFFVRDDLDTVIIDGWELVEPKMLLSFYSSIHSSDKCWAVKAAINLIDNNEEVIRSERLIKNPLSN